MKNQEIIVNVIFDAARGESPIASREATVGQPLGALPRPVRPGYSFEGWTLDGAPVSEETVLVGEDDIRLLATWTRKRNAESGAKKQSKKNSMLKRQRAAVIVLAVAAVVLALTLVFVNQLVTVYSLTDTYYTEEGEQTEKYRIRKKGGLYGLYDRKGNAMEVNEQGYYIAKSGNQYEIDPETGEASLYAVVDYDAAGGEVLGFSDRIMLFPQIRQTNVSSITVQNQYGEYTFYKDTESNTVKLKGYEGEKYKYVSYDPTLYASLCVSCGYTLSMQKLDLSMESNLAPRREDGSVDYDAYGLADRYDADGKLIYSPAVYTISGVDTQENTVTHSVRVGEPILSGAGYYIQMVGRDAVYIVSSDIATTVLQPVEAMITPLVSYPATMSTYPMVSDFLLGKITGGIPIGQGEDGALEIKDIKEENLSTIVGFSYWDLESRLNSIYSSRPYISLVSLMTGYEIDSNNVSTVLGNLYEMEYIACRKLGITAECLAEYRLDGKSGDVYYMYYKAPVADSSNNIIGYEPTPLFISPKTENGTYYVASFLTNMIVEIDQYYFSFLQWEVSDWYDQYFFSQNIADANSFSVEVGGSKYEFAFDNSASYYFYEADGKMKQVDLSTGRMENGKYIDQNGASHNVTAFDLRNGKTEIEVTDKNGEVVASYPYEKYLVTSDKDGRIVLKLYESKTAEKVAWEEVISEGGKTNYSYRVVYINPDGARYYVLGSYTVGEQTGKDYYRLPVWQQQSDGTWERKEAIAGSVFFRRVETGKEYSPSLGSNNLKLQYSLNGGALQDLDYTITYSYLNDKKQEKVDTITAVDNFRKLYTKLMWYSIEGDVDPEEFATDKGMTVEEYLKSENRSCLATITYSYEDFSAAMNYMSGASDEKELSPEVKLWIENNSAAITVRLYQYTDRKALLTVEVAGLTDKDGNPIGEQGKFYVQATYVEQVLLPAIEKLIAQEPIAPKG